MSWSHIAWFIMDYQIEEGAANYTLAFKSEDEARKHIERMHVENFDDAKCEFKPKRGFELALLYEITGIGEIVEIDQYSTIATNRDGIADGWFSSR